MKVEPGRGGDLHLDPIGKNRGSSRHRRAVAAGLANDGSGLAGNRRLIDRSHALDDFAVAGNEIPSLDENDVSNPQIERRDTLDDALHPALALGIDQPLRMRVASRPAKGVGLRLAAPFRDGFGEIGE